MVWSDASELPETLNNGSTYSDLVQTIQKLGMQQMMFQIHYNSPNEKVFTARMKDLILVSGSPGTSKTIVALLAPHVDWRVHEMTL